MRFVKGVVFFFSAAMAVAGEVLFEEVKESGIEEGHGYRPGDERAFLYHSGFGVGGVFLGDVDGDGRGDVYVTDGSGGCRLWMNRGGMKFEKGGLPEGLGGGEEWATGAALVDVEGDGDVDVYQCFYDAPNRLFLNDGAGGFSEVKGACGLGVRDASHSPYFSDFDGDGDVDLFLMCNRYYRAGGRPEKPPFREVDGVPVVLPEYEKFYRLKKTPSGKYHMDNYGRRDYLFVNEGVGEDGLPRFRDVSEGSGVGMMGHGLSAVWWDYDDDGDEDLHVCNDFSEPDRLFRNEGVGADGVPKFVEVAEEVYPAVSWSAMGSDVGDLNNDGLVDLVTVDMAATTHLKAKSNMGAITPHQRELMMFGRPRQEMRNHVYLNTGRDFFSEVAYGVGLAQTDWSWAVKVGDLDNDGWEDAFFSNGMVKNFTDADQGAKIGDRRKALIGRTAWELYGEAEPLVEENLAFRNVGGERFERRDDWGLNLKGISYAAASGDLDGDGDLDLVVSDLGKGLKLFRNESAAGGGVVVRLRGKVSHADGWGAKVVVRDSEGVERTRWHQPSTGYLSQDDGGIHFGLGGARAVEVWVRWPSGVEQRVGWKAGEVTMLIEEAGEVKAAEEVKDRGRFEDTEITGYEHKEAMFDDFSIQPLLPQKLTQLGPCLVVGDVDGDGDDDFLVGGARGQEAMIFLTGKGGLDYLRQEAFAGEAARSEVVDGVWFDVEGDGDLDLYLVTGSAEFRPRAAEYVDQLFINEGTREEMKLVKAKYGILPSSRMSGSCVAAGDYDGDGDVDLFVGARSIPGEYPVVPKSELLRNDSEGGEVKFTRVTPELLETVGMVTAAEWVDVDGGGGLDLCVAVDWGPVRVFRNVKGEFTEVALPVGSGWWRALKAVDVDGDGDMDLVAGNSGMNTKYGTLSEKYPAMIYYGDLDGSGKARIVEAKREKKSERPLPVRGRF